MLQDRGRSFSRRTSCYRILKMDIASKKILVTGGAGFIGSCFVRQLLKSEDCRVTNLDKLTYAGNLDSLAAVSAHPHHHLVQGDIADSALVARLFKEFQPDAV